MLIHTLRELSVMELFRFIGIHCMSNSLSKNLSYLKGFIILIFNHVPGYDTLVEDFQQRTCEISI